MRYFASLDDRVCSAHQSSAIVSVPKHMHAQRTQKRLLQAIVRVKLAFIGMHHTCATVAIACIWARSRACHLLPGSTLAFNGKGIANRQTALVLRAFPMHTAPLAARRSSIATLSRAMLTLRAMSHLPVQHACPHNSSLSLPGAAASCASSMGSMSSSAGSSGMSNLILALLLMKDASSPSDLSSSNSMAAHHDCGEEDAWTSCRLPSASCRVAHTSMLHQWLQHAPAHASFMHRWLTTVEHVQ